MYTCPFCGLAFSTASRYNDHLFTDHDDGRNAR